MQETLLYSAAIATSRDSSKADAATLNQLNWHMFSAQADLAGLAEERPTFRVDQRYVVDSFKPEVDDEHPHVSPALEEMVAARDRAFASTDKYTTTGKTVTHALQSRTVHEAATALGVFPPASGSAETNSTTTTMSLSVASEQVRQTATLRGATHVEGARATDDGDESRSASGTQPAGKLTSKRRAASSKTNTGASKTARLDPDITDVKATLGPMYGRAHVEGQLQTPFADAGHDVPFQESAVTSPQMTASQEFGRQYMDPLVSLVNQTLTLNPKQTSLQTAARVLAVGTDGPEHGLSDSTRGTVDQLNGLYGRMVQSGAVPVLAELGGTHRRRQSRSVVLSEDVATGMISVTPFGAADDDDDGDEDDDNVTDAMDVDHIDTGGTGDPTHPMHKNRSSSSPMPKRKKMESRGFDGAQDHQPLILVGGDLLVPRKLKTTRSSNNTGAKEKMRDNRAAVAAGAPTDSGGSQNKRRRSDSTADAADSRGGGGGGGGDGDIYTNKPNWSLFTQQKLVADPTIVEEWPVYKFMATVVKKREQNPLKTGDAPQFGTFIRDIQGQPAQISKSAEPVGYNERTKANSVACDFAEVARAAFSTDEATQAQNLARLSGVSVADAKRAARSMHPQVAQNLDAERIMHQFQGYAQEDMQIFLSECIDKDLREEAARKLANGAGTTTTDTSLTGSFNLSELRYRFADETAAQHAKEIYAESVAEISERNSAVFFDLLERQEARLKERGQPCYSNREELLSKGTLPEHQCKVETIDREYMQRWYRSYTVPEVIDEQQWFFCGNGAKCECRTIAQKSKTYGMYYTSGAYVNGHSAKTSAFGVSMSTTTATSAGDDAAMDVDTTTTTAAAATTTTTTTTTTFKRRHLAKLAYNGAVAQNSPRVVARRLFHPRVVASKSDDELRADVEAVLSGTKEWNISSGFVGVQFLTPDELAQFEQWKRVGQSPALAATRGPDPREHVNPLCLACYIVQVNIQHFQHLHQTTTAPNIHTHTREWKPLNRFQVPRHAYADHAVLDTSSGWGTSGSSRFGEGRHLIVGVFPRYRADFFTMQSYVDTGVPSMIPVSTSDARDTAGLVIDRMQRLRIVEQYMDFRHS